MVYLSSRDAQKARKRALPVRAIVIHIAYVIEVQYTDARHTDCNATPDDFVAQTLKLQVITSERAQQSEEQEHPQVTQPHITVAMLAEGVCNRTHHREQTQAEEDKTLEACERTESAVNQRRTKDDTQSRKEPNHALHLLDSDGSGLQSVGGATLLVRVRTFLCVP